jgi:hypothetical protein
MRFRTVFITIENHAIHHNSTLKLSAENPQMPHPLQHLGCYARNAKYRDNVLTISYCDKKHHEMMEKLQTLFDIMIVSRALLCELKATFRVLA